jgi:transportin-1
MVLYDAFGTLAECVGDALGKPELLNKFMPVLINRWQEIPDDDYGLLPLLEV